MSRKDYTNAMFLPLTNQITDFTIQHPGYIAGPMRTKPDVYLYNYGGMRNGIPRAYNAKGTDAMVSHHTGNRVSCAKYMMVSKDNVFKA